MTSRSIEQAVAALRRGEPVAIVDGPTILPLETATRAMLDHADPGGEANLLVSGARAAALGLGNRLAAADERMPVRIERCDWLDRDTAQALFDPAGDFSRGPIGPLTPLEAGPHDGAAIQLLGLAGLLPAAWLVEKAAIDIDPAALDEARRSVTLVARARLPLDDLPASQMAVFRDGATGEEHAALIVGAFEGRPPLVRLHSECLTGDVFGSLKCDCGPQLRHALRIIGDEGGGILLYLRQEGRGIGLANKIRAYALQDRGLDTVDANRRLGFADDERDYGVAAAILRALGADAVRLLTNNPNKVEGLEAEGIRVAERVRHHMPPNPHNAAYLETKKARSGHHD
ncbi:GTP cyclohydrolase II [Sphingomicrobium lutaoense]|uniref:GTP cyclohydrolase-2 n=1 Tax=Sphingomicrobium lutaoense TaxID=515949 RepID=A0A839Z2B6_9SPHN|nr:GTP cyclohydrolase II [Sphingomicrobium lutaoense]MBB3764780.1 GTP cyclohydrolase II [Sphingomicrobium lutaoense]